MSELDDLRHFEDVAVTFRLLLDGNHGADIARGPKGAQTRKSPSVSRTVCPTYTEAPELGRLGAVFYHCTFPRASAGRYNCPASPPEAPLLRSLTEAILVGIV